MSWRVWPTLLVLLGTMWAVAARVVVDTGNDESSQLEVRTITLPDGAERSLYIIRGEHVTVTINNETTLSGTHLEFDFEQQTVRLVGSGTVRTADETITATNLFIHIEDERFVGNNVLIVTGEIDVIGNTASRVPGQIQVAMGQFSPCARCGQEVHDYGFTGERVHIYPGDRIVAYNATILLRNVPVLKVPLLVLPTGPQERIPRLRYERGTDTERALIGIVWPYVAGPAAYGNIGLRYYADVVPGSWLQNTLLGGAPLREYVGGSLDHLFYTDRGSGSVHLDYTPAFRNADGTSTTALWSIDAQYADSEAAPAPWFSGALFRHDERFPNLWQLQLGAKTIVDPFTVQVRHNITVERDLAAPFTYPPNYRRNAPLNEYFHVSVVPTERRTVAVGPFRLERFELRAGVYGDFSNPLNRAASVRPFVQAGRAEQWVAFTLPQTNILWPGLTVAGANEFRGQQYSTGERQVLSVANIAFEQAFRSASSVSVTWRRDVQEGETPFQFDALPFRHYSDIRARVRLTPWRWFEFEQTGGYLIIDSRAGKEREWLPLVSRLTLFRSLSWLSFSAHHEYDFANDDPGEVTLSLQLRARGTAHATLELEHVYDLREPTLTAGYVVNETATRARAVAGITNIAEVELAGGYRYYPEPKQHGEPGNYYEDITGRLLLGTLHHRDKVPGAQFRVGYDMNERKVNAFGVELALTVFDFEFDAQVQYRFPSHEIQRSQLQLKWPGVLLVRAEGLAWFPAEYFGISPDPYVRRLLYTVADAPERGGTKWELRYRTEYDPSLAGYRRSQFDARVQLARYDVGPLEFSVDGFLEMPVKDHVLEHTYIRRASVAFSLQAWDVIGFQGRIGYSGTYSSAQGEVVEGRLQLQRVSIVARPFEDIYVGMTINDIWDITGNSTEYPAMNFQPTFTLVWNRCCWALYSSWNTETGAITITLTTPGSDAGIGHMFETDYRFRERTP